MSKGRRRSALPRKWQQIRVSVLHRDRYLCQLQYPGCTRAATEVDHIGAHDDHATANLQAVCRRCHASKTGREANAARAPQPKRVRAAEPHPGDVT